MRLAQAAIVEIAETHLKQYVTEKRKKVRDNPAQQRSVFGVQDVRDYNVRLVPQTKNPGEGLYRRVVRAVDQGKILHPGQRYAFLVNPPAVVRPVVMHNLHVFMLPAQLFGNLSCAIRASVIEYNDFILHELSFGGLDSRQDRVFNTLFLIKRRYQNGYRIVRSHFTRDPLCISKKNRHLRRIENTACLQASQDDALIQLQFRQRGGADGESGRWQGGWRRCRSRDALTGRGCGEMSAQWMAQGRKRP